MTTDMQFLDAPLLFVKELEPGNKACSWVERYSQLTNAQILQFLTYTSFSPAWKC